MFMERLIRHYRKPDDVLALRHLGESARFPGQPEAEGKMLLRLLRQPALEPVEVWALFQKADSYRIRWVHWDPERSGPDGPAITSSEADFDAAVADSFVEELAVMSVPTMPRQERFVICDGDCHAVLIGDQHLQVTTEFCWPGNPPVGWEELSAWFDRLLAAVQAAFPADAAKHSLPPEWVGKYRLATGQLKE